MKINDLQNQQVVRYRLGRAGRHAVEWEDWIEGPLYIQRFKNQVTTLVPELKNGAWAEYDPRRDYCPQTDGSGLLLAEDYYMEIEGLNGL